MEKIKVATNSWCGFYTIYVYVKNLGYETINVDDIKVELLEVPGKVEKLEWGAKQILPGGTAGLKVSFYEKEGSKNYKIKLIDPVGKVHYEEGSCT
jgi:archaellum component FlaG (FlaF/FlaG flagellin family)